MLKCRWGECRFFVCQRRIMMRKNNISNYFFIASLGSFNFFYKEKAAGNNLLRQPFV